MIALDKSYHSTCHSLAFELLFRNDFDTRGHTVMSKAAKFITRHSETFLAEAQSLSHTGSFGWSVATGEIYWSAETSNIFEYDRTAKPTLEMVLRRTYPDDRDLVQQTRGRASEARADFELEHRLLMPNGSVKHLHVSARALTNSSGDLEFVGAVTDVTAVKEAEEKIRQDGHELRRIVDAIPNIVVVLNPDGQRIYVNRVALEYTGLSIEEMLTESAHARISHPEDMERLREVRQDALIKGLPFEFEQRVRGKDGKYRWYLMRYNPVLDEQEHIVRWYATGTDIEDRKQAEDKIRQSEIELRQILDFAPQHVAVLGHDLNRTLLYANQAVLDYYGLTLDKWRSSDRRKYYHPDDWERLTSEAQSKFLSGLPHEYEARFMGKDGKYRWFLFRWNPLRDEQGQVKRWYATAMDINDRKHAEQRLQNENVALREDVDRFSMFEEIIGSCEPMRQVLKQVTKVASSASTVLILGETGTRKELIARALHRRSNRASRAFVRVNCAAIPQSLIASELFGHEKGAFTGALQRRIGRFESADGGTLFLDEVGDLPMETQIVLLRVLQEREFERVGSNHPISVDVRLIAATNRDLPAAVAAGTFRRDLFYRLNVVPIVVPPLRERAADIPLLVEYFVGRYAKAAGKTIRHIGKQTLKQLTAYNWPGNIRELQNVVERAVILNETDTFFVDESWLKLESAESRPPREGLSTLSDREVEIIEAALADCNGRIAGPSGAAAKLGIPRSTLESKIRRFGINKYALKGQTS